MEKIFEYAKELHLYSTIFFAVLIICLLFVLIHLFKFIQVIWLRYIDRNEKEKMEADRKLEQEILFKRKKELMKKQEPLRDL